MSDDPQPIWLNHVIAWGGAIIAATTTLFGGAYVRLFRHEERIKTLEDHHRNKMELLQNLSEKVDHNHAETAKRIESMGEEIRADLRVIMTRCLSFSHKD